MALNLVGSQWQWRNYRTPLGHNGIKSLRGRALVLNLEKGIALKITRKKRIHVAAAASFTDQQIASNTAEQQLVEGLLGIQGRGRSASAEQLKEVNQAIQALESAGGVSDPTSSSLIEGRWQLLFTTRPGTASPIQRTFVGVDAFTVFQEICLRDTDDPRVSNIVQFSDAIGELKVEAAALIEDGNRILFRFDRAAFNFKFLPFKVPYPVPFRLLGDEAKGWLDTTYLSHSGNIRISRGNKGTTFVLQKQIEPRQKLLSAITSGKGVQEAIEELLVLNHNNGPVDIDFLAGKWRLLWSSQPKDGNLLERVANGLQNMQIVKDTGQLENLVEFIPGFRLRSRGNVISIANQRGEVIIKGSTLELGLFKLPLQSTSKILLDFLYVDKKICITRGDQGWLFVHVHEVEFD
eukprot:Gb_09730 [translate_table: standard]